MKRVEEIRRGSGGPALFVVVAGIVLSASACGGTHNTTLVCSPDLAVRWQIVDSASAAARTCDQVGATTISVDIGGHTTDFLCPTGESAGTIAVYPDAA